MTSEALRFGERPDIVFLIGCWLGESKRYRVYNLAAALRRRGYTCRVHDFYRARDLVAFDVVPQIAVLFRAPYDPSVGIVELLEHFRHNCVRTVFDIDDYVFEPTATQSIASIADFDSHERHGYEWGVRAYRALMFCCDRTTTTTDVLANHMRDLGREAFIVVNTLNDAQLEQADRLLSQGRHTDDVIRIGYYSGSKTHQADFAQCAGAIREMMRRDPRIRFRLVGLLDLDESWLPFAERIERAGFMDPLDMLDDLHRCDINIAPLEVGNVFCESKSELKFFEAAVVGVPTIASPTAPFCDVIQDGINGMLAGDEAEWLEKLAMLGASDILRTEMGVRARLTALEHFAPDVAARQALIAYGLETAEDMAMVRREGVLRIGWILPNIIIGGGGHRNILRAAYHLEQFGYDVRLYVSDTSLSPAALRQQVRRHFYEFTGPVLPFHGHVDGEDVLIATHWSTVELAESVAAQVGHILYFVQDFEPAFYPMGAEYIFAENTYRKGLYAICSGPWCARLLKEEYACEADFFRFPVDRDVYRPLDDETPKCNRILFFAKPEMPRRCYAVGVAALRIVHRLRPDVEIMFFGSQAAEAAPLDFPVTHASVLPGIDDLARLYAGARLGVVFSTTNPSLVPYEMMACGLPVVDIDLPGNAVNYDDRRDIALLAGPMPEHMAEQIVALLDDDAELAARSRNSLDFVATFPVEEEMARTIESLILARVKKASGEDVPVVAWADALVS